MKRKYRIKLKSADLAGLTYLQEELARGAEMDMVASYHVPSVNMAAVPEILDVEVEGANAHMFDLLDVEVIEDESRTIGEIIESRDNR